MQKGPLPTIRPQRGDAWSSHYECALTCVLDIISSRFVRDSENASMESGRGTSLYPSAHYHHLLRLDGIRSLVSISPSPLVA